MSRHVLYERAVPAVTRAGASTAGIERLLDAATHFLLPAWCAGCAARLPWRPSPLGLCASCRRELPLPPPHRCARCGAPAKARRRGAGCSACARRPPAFDALVAAWSYQPPIDEVIRRLKYGRLEFLADDLAAGIVGAIADAERFDAVTAVPLHWRRRLERGYDQAALLAAAVGRGTGVPYRRFLVRSRSTPPQVARSAAGRRDNVAGAFRCRRGAAAALVGARVLLVDDVVTTGATLHAASAALKIAGAVAVTAAVAARTPPRR